MTATNPTARSIVNSALDGSVGGLTLLYGLLQSDGEYLSMLLQNSGMGMALLFCLMLLFSGLFSILAVVWELSFGDGEII
jgi:hypothetical protein